MRDRLIRGGILDSDNVNKLTWAGEVFFRRLLHVADDYSHMDARESILRTSMYPLKLNQVSDADIAKWLKECSDAGLISFYEVGQKRFIEVKNFGQKMKWRKEKYPQPTPLPEHPPPKNSSQEKRREVETEVEIEAEERENVRAREEIFKIFKTKFPIHVPNYDSKFKKEKKELIAWKNDRKAEVNGNPVEQDKLKRLYEQKLEMIESRKDAVVHAEVEKFYIYYDSRAWTHSTGTKVTNMTRTVENWLLRKKEFDAKKK